MKSQADVWVVAGPPGAGKTTVAGILLELLDPVPALLDKDTMYNPIEDAVLREAGHPISEREGDWYDMHLKPFVHDGIEATTREVRSYGCPVIVSLPFTKQIHSEGGWAGLVDKLGGGTVRLVWVHSDADTLRQRLETRGLERDGNKLQHFDDFVSYMQPESRPPVPHLAVDNRIGAPDLHEQIQQLLQGVNVS